MSDSQTSHLPDDLKFIAPIALDDMIRMGRDHDGGYVLPERIVAKADGLVSFGLNDDWSFEEDYLARFPGRPIDAYDHTVGDAHFRREARRAIPRAALGRISFARAREILETAEGYRRIFKGNVRHFEKMVTNRPTAAQTDVVGALDAIDARRVLLKIDIEGSEYRIFDQIVANAPRISGVCMEIHDVDPHRASFIAAMKAMTGPFAVAHLHANNYGKTDDKGFPDTLEMTFVNRDLVADEALRDRIYLDGLDQPNDPGRPEMVVER